MKIIRFFILGALIICLLTVSISAVSVNTAHSGKIAFPVYKRTADLVMDGVITEGEYYKLDLNKEWLTYLWLGENEDKAYSLGDTIEYWFSWDDTNFNIAVKYKPTDLIQTIKASPNDNFMCDVGLQVSFGANIENKNVNEEVGHILYHAIAKATDDGTYLQGYWTQRGLSENYSPVEEKDFYINYPGDGSVVYEWFVPFAEFTKDAAAEGSKVYFSIGANAGTDDGVETWSNTYGAALGDFAFLVNDQKNHATAVLSPAPVTETVESAETVNMAASENTEVKPTVTAPQTSNLLLIPAIGILASAILFKNRKNKNTNIK